MSERFPTVRVSWPVDVLIQDVEISLGQFAREESKWRQQELYKDLNAARQALYTYISKLEHDLGIYPHVTKRFE